MGVQGLRAKMQALRGVEAGQTPKKMTLVARTLTRVGFGALIR